ncbi:MAG: methyltransferase domain-containing protein [Nitrospina sp.]|nr:MAG: methyltransferase domain-containing protein [Nitrospina sp.]TDJ60915.1 MAG: methyltransferase domain-containing protein [Nitrospina sp.]
MPGTLVFTATYNEADNVENLLNEIISHLPDADILIVDDHSPDGTGPLLDQLAAKNSRIHVVHRPSKLGLGTAHLLAMKYALHHNYEHLITMDADFSHNPKYLTIMKQLLEDNDFVIGSRYAKGGRCDYGLVRTLISRTANTLARYLLGIPTHEATTSYRGFSVDLLRQMDLNSIWSDGYSFFMESIFVVRLATRKLAEFPIHFEDRRAGTSKISKREIFKAIYNIFRLFYRRLFVIPFAVYQPNADIEKDPPCENCNSLFHMEMFPARFAANEDPSIYQCTSAGHRTHGRILKCLHCGLVFNETRHDAEKLLDFYSDVEDPTYLKNIDSRFKTFRYNFEKIKPRLPASGKLLDIGSYCGVSLKVAHENGFETLGVEPSKWAARYSEEVMQERVFQGTLKDLPAEEGPFDVITMWDVMEHLPHPVEEMKRIHSRLKPGGVFVFSTLFIDNWYPKIMKERWPWYMDMHLFYFTLDALSQLLTKAGLELVHHQKYTHIITLEYFFFKLDALGVFGAKYLGEVSGKTRLRNIMIPFSFGDIQMFICKRPDDS